VRSIIEKVLLVPNKELQLLASLPGRFKRWPEDRPIMLCQTHIAKLFTVAQQTISEWIRALKTLQVLRLAEPAVKKARAVRY